MSYGVFFGLRVGAVDDGTAELVSKRLADINAGLRLIDRTPLRDKDPAVVEHEEHRISGFRGTIGWSMLNHHGGRSLSGLGEAIRAFVDESPGPLEVLAGRIHGLTYLPSAFRGPLSIAEDGKSDLSTGLVWSSRQMIKDLARVAPHLGIPLRGWHVDEVLASRINDYEALTTKDTPDTMDKLWIPGVAEPYGLADGLRTAWLLLFEAARISSENRIAFRILG